MLFDALKKDNKFIIFMVIFSIYYYNYEKQRDYNCTNLTSYIGIAAAYIILSDYKNNKNLINMFFIFIAEFHTLHLIY